VLFEVFAVVINENAVVQPVQLKLPTASTVPEIQLLATLGTAIQAPALFK